MGVACSFSLGPPLAAGAIDEDDAVMAGAPEDDDAAMTQITPKPRPELNYRSRGGAEAQGISKQRQPHDAPCIGKSPRRYKRNRPEVWPETLTNKAWGSTTEHKLDPIGMVIIR